MAADLPIETFRFTPGVIGRGRQVVQNDGRGTPEGMNVSMAVVATMTRGQSYEA